MTEASATGPGGPAWWSRHIPSHRGLVPTVEACVVPGSSAAGVDAVIVPASREAGNISHAAEFAALAGAELLVLTSHKANPIEVATVAARSLPPDRTTVVPVPARWSLPGLSLRADQMSLSATRDSNTSAKRNAGLALARLRRWERIVFLDDDVEGMGAAELRTIRDGLAEGTGLDAVGWAFDDFPDNSLVCHANRLAGGPQDTFIGGGALALRVSPSTPHCPRVYNEDWLLMLPMMLRKKPTIAFAGTLGQAPFDPFQNAGDADKQEFGDVLAEGLFRLPHLNRPIEVAERRSFWRHVLFGRRAFIRRTRATLSRTAPHQRSVLDALDHALSLDLSIEPDELAGWVQDWRVDRLSWATYLQQLPEEPRTAAALQRVGLGEGAVTFSRAA